LGAVGKRLAEILVRQGISAVQRALNGDLSMMNALKEFLEEGGGETTHPRPDRADQTAGFLGQKSQIFCLRGLV
jgi:hypothetical protein